MATVSSLGVGAGVDLQSILDKLLEVERTPIRTLDRRIASTNETISLYGQLRSRLDALGTAADTFRFPSRLSAMGASSSDDTVATASASFVATAGSYAVNVVQLASAQKSFTQAYDAGTTFGQGQLDFIVGGVAHAIDLNDQASYTLQEIRGKINDANIGVTATVVSGTDGDRLILTGSQTGADGAFSFSSTITASDSQPGLDDLDTDPSLAISTAQDGMITIDGVTVSSSTNTYADAVNGLTFNAKTVGATTITVATDTDRITEAAREFVTAYNEVVNLIKSNSSFDASTSTGGIFSGDMAARNIRDVLTRARMSVPDELTSASLNTLSQIGISIQQNGELALDETKLQSTLSTSAADVVSVLSSYGQSFSTAVTAFFGAEGTLSRRVETLNLSIKNFRDQQERLEFRVSNIERSYRRQFTALDTLISQMTVMSNYLAQQLAGLSQNNG